MSEHTPSFARTCPDFLRRVAVTVGFLIALLGTIINPATASAVTLVFVVTVTAWLVAAAS